MMSQEIAFYHYVLDKMKLIKYMCSNVIQFPSEHTIWVNKIYKNRVLMSYDFIFNKVKLIKDLFLYCIS